MVPQGTVLEPTVRVVGRRTGSPASEEEVAVDPWSEGAPATPVVVVALDAAAVTAYRLVRKRLR